jgi:hypothetical protein
MLDLFKGQGMEIYFRDNYICPSVEEYQEYAKRSKDWNRYISYFNWIHMLLKMGIRDFVPV